MFNREFQSYPVSSDLNTVITLKNVTVHIVGDRRHFSWDKASAYGSPVAGYATTKNEIHVFGRIEDGKIRLNQAVLGHELTHLLHFKNPAVCDPDRLE